jgi:hypothetical protein
MPLEKEPDVASETLLIQQASGGSNKGLGASLRRGDTEFEDRAISGA